MLIFSKPLKYIVNLAKINSKTTIRIIVFSLFYILCESMVPFLVKALLSSINQRPLIHIVKLTAAVLITYSITRLFWALSDYEVAKLKIAVKGYLRNNLHKKLLRLPVYFFKNNLPGEIISKMTADVEIIGENSPLFPALLSAFIEIIVVCLVLFKLNPILAIITIATFPIYSICEKRYKPILEKSAEKERKASDPIVESIRENIAGIFTLKLFRVYDYFDSIFNKKIRDWSDISRYRARYFYIYYGITTYIEYTLPLFILGIGSILAANNLVDFPTVVAFFTFVGRAYVPVWNINFLLTTIPGSYPSVRRIMEILEHEEEKTIKGLHFPEIELIIFDSVHFSYNNSNIINNVNIKIPGEKWTAIVGPTGSGKSTLCLLLTGLYEPKEGTILLNNKPLSVYDTDQFRKKVIYVANKDFIFNASIKDNLTMGVYFDNLRIKRICEICLINEFTHDLDTIATNLSDGQKQRIAIARALLREPALLILDETMATLDSEAENAIVKNIKKEYPTLTVIIVSHRLSTIIGVDQVIFIKNGKIINTGTHNTLLRECFDYRNLFDKQLIKDVTSSVL